MFGSCWSSSGVTSVLALGLGICVLTDPAGSPGPWVQSIHILPFPLSSAHWMGLMTIPGMNQKTKRRKWMWYAFHSSLANFVRTASALLDTAGWLLYLFRRKIDSSGVE